MASQASNISHTSQASHESSAMLSSRLSGPRTAVNEPLLRTAERELKSALVEQERPIAGMYVPASNAGDAALDRAVHAVCREAHALDVRAEELLIAVKQAWSLLATTRAHHLGERDADVLREFVTATIELFFEPRDTQSNSR